MSETDAAIIGVQLCGCITYANARPDDLDREDHKVIGRIVADGGQIIRTTVGEARQRPHFLEGECPHDPKGWERDPPPSDPEKRIRLRRNGYRKLYIVDRGRLRIGEVGERSGGWYATRGWLDREEASANDGSEARGPAEVAGPFSKRQGAVDFLAQTEPEAKSPNPSSGSSVVVAPDLRDEEKEESNG